MIRRRVVVVVAAVLVACGDGCSRGGGEAAPEAARRVPPARLVDAWVRMDGGYVLDVRAIKPAGGAAEVQYFNPRPINVAEASVGHSNNQLQLYVRLNDRGYPDSTYELTYDEIRDTLEGEYFQATMGQTYRVSFVRRPE